MQNLQFLTKKSSRLDLHCLQKFGGEASVVPCAGDKSPIQTTLSIEYKGVKDSKKYTLVKFTRIHQPHEGQATLLCCWFQPWEVQ